MSVPDGIFPIRIRSRIWLDAECFELTCTRPPDFSFAPGQYVAFHVQGQTREYTILSGPDEDGLRFLVRRMEQGAVSRFLAEVEPGSMLAISRAKGYLIYRPGNRPVFFAATGVGIAPFVAMAAAGVRGFALLHGAADVAGLHYRSQLLDAAGQYIPCLSRPGRADPPLPGLFHGRVTAWVRQHLAPGSYDFYLCGSPEMIRDMTHLLDQSFAGTRIYSEAFS